MIGEVRGIGPMAAIELVKDRETREPAADVAAATVAGALERGLLLLKTGIYDNVLRILVPITATEEDLDAGARPARGVACRSRLSPTTAAAVTLRGVRKSYGDVDAVDGRRPRRRRTASSSRCSGRPARARPRRCA